MGRRDMEVGDAVAVNDNGCKGIGFVVASSDDPEKTGGVGAAGRTAYLIRWVLGKNLQHGTTMGARGESWLNDDPKRIRIYGVQGYTMPKRFMGRNVARLCKGDNEFIGLPAPHDVWPRCLSSACSASCCRWCSCATENRRGFRCSSPFPQSRQSMVGMLGSRALVLIIRTITMKVPAGHRKIRMKGPHSRIRIPRTVRTIVAPLRGIRDSIPTTSGAHGAEAMA